MKGRFFKMDCAQLRSIIEANGGTKKCIQIIFDNGRTWLTFRAKMDDKNYPVRDTVTNKIQFDRFDDLVIIDDATDSVKLLERQHGANKETRDAIRWYIVTPAECIQGLNFLPPDISEEEEYKILTHWDHTIV